MISKKLLLMSATAASLLIAAPAFAGGPHHGPGNGHKYGHGDWRHVHKHYKHYKHHAHRPVVVVPAAPVYYQPEPVVVYRPVTVYRPAPVYYPPVHRHEPGVRVSIGFGF